jgi:drug/metabolite transporter (DMT)-like permease
VDIKLRAYVYLVVSLLIGSFTPALLVYTRGTNAFELFLLASLTSIPVGLMLVAKNRKFGALAGLLESRKKLFYTVLAGLLMYVPYEYGIAYAEHFISASLATVLFRLNPILMLVFLAVLMRERLSSRQVLALSLAFIGIFIGVSGGNVTNLLANSNISIIIFVVVMALGYALANVIVKWQMLDNDLFLATSTIALAVLFLVLFLGSGAKFAPMNSIDIAIILYLAVTNIFSFYMYVHALKLLKTTTVTNTFLLSPFLTFIWAYALYGTPIQIYYLAIAVLVSLGIVIQRTDKKGGSYLPRKAGSSENSFTIFDVTGAFIGSNDPSIVNTISSGGRVFATKLSGHHSSHVSSMMRDARFANVYNGNETRIFNEAKFVKDILGASGDDAIVIKTGNIPENEEFFEELNRRIAASPKDVPRQ